MSAHIDTVIGFAEQASRYDDAWAGLTWSLEQQLEIEAQSRGLGELLRSRNQATALVRRTHERMTPLVADGARENIDELSRKHIGRPHPGFGGGPQQRVILTVKVDRVHKP